MCKLCEESREELRIATQAYSRMSRQYEPFLATTPLGNSEIPLLPRDAYDQMVKLQLAQKRQHRALSNWTECSHHHS